MGKLSGQSAAHLYTFARRTDTNISSLGTNPSTREPQSPKAEDISEIATARALA